MSYRTLVRSISCLLFNPNSSPCINLYLQTSPPPVLLLCPHCHPKHRRSTCSHRFPSLITWFALDHINHWKLAFFHARSSVIIACVASVTAVQHRLWFHPFAISLSEVGAVSAAFSKALISSSNEYLGCICPTDRSPYHHTARSDDSSWSGTDVQDWLLT